MFLWLLFQQTLNILKITKFLKYHWNLQKKNRTIKWYKYVKNVQDQRSNPDFLFDLESSSIDSASSCHKDDQGTFPAPSLCWWYFIIRLSTKFSEVAEENLFLFMGTLSQNLRKFFVVIVDHRTIYGYFTKSEKMFQQH